jgi:hypothetical protein
MKDLQIQKAVYTALVAALDVPVFDNVPQNSPYPYVVVGDDTAVPWDTDDSLGTEATVTVHAWSQYRGRAEAKELLQQIYTALHRQDIAVENAVTIESIAEFQQTIVESDGLTRHGIIRFRITVDQLNLEG